MHLLLKQAAAVVMTTATTTKSTKYFPRTPPPKSSGSKTQVGLGGRIVDRDDFFPWARLLKRGSLERADCALCRFSSTPTNLLYLAEKGLS